MKKAFVLVSDSRRGEVDADGVCARRSNGPLIAPSPDLSGLSVHRVIDGRPPAWALADRFLFVCVLLDATTSLKEIHRFRPGLVSCDRKGSHDLSIEPSKSFYNLFGVSWVFDIIGEPPVLGILKEVCFPFTVAPSKSSINRRGNTPNFCDPPGWGWWAKGSEHPEIMTSEGHHGPIAQGGECVHRATVA